MTKATFRNTINTTHTAYVEVAGNEMKESVMETNS